MQRMRGRGSEGRYRRTGRVRGGGRRGRKWLFVVLRLEGGTVLLEMKLEGVRKLVDEKTERKKTHLVPNNAHNLLLLPFETLSNVGPSIPPSRRTPSRRPLSSSHATRRPFPGRSPAAEKVERRSRDDGVSSSGVETDAARRTPPPSRMRCHLRLATNQDGRERRIQAKGRKGRRSRVLLRPPGHRRSASRLERVSRRPSAFEGGRGRPSAHSAFPRRPLPPPSPCLFPLHPSSSQPSPAA
jgi:hypothetical protein